MRRGLVVPLLFIILTMIIGCTSIEEPLTDQTEPNQVSEEQATPDSTKEKEPEIPASFNQLPEELVLAPGGEYQLQVEGAHYSSDESTLLSVDKSGMIQVADDAMIGKQSLVTVSVHDQTKEIHIKIKYALEDTITTINGVPTVTNPADTVVLVNKERALPSDYIPENLVAPEVPFTFKEQSEKKLLRAEAAKALEALFTQAKEDGIDLVAVSGYRSYKTQKAIFDRNVETKGKEVASQYSAHPGHSEHQTGLSIDVYNHDYKGGLEESFADSDEGKWLAENVARFGFIIRYPKGKEEITGYNYEPWHIRYVGMDAAEEIMGRSITLEEYFQDVIPVSKNK